VVVLIFYRETRYLEFETQKSHKRTYKKVKRLPVWKKAFYKYVKEHMSNYNSLDIGTFAF